MGIFCCFRFLSSNSPTNLQWILKKLPVSFKVNPARRRAVETESALYYLTSKSWNFGGRIALSLRCALNSALTGYEYGGIRALPKSVIHAGILEGEANGLFHLSGIQAGPDRRWAGARPSGWKSPAPPVCPSCPRRACRSYRLYSSRPTPHRFCRAGLLLKVSFLFFRTPRTGLDPAPGRLSLPGQALEYIADIRFAVPGVDRLLRAGRHVIPRAVRPAHFQKAVVPDPARRWRHCPR